jgi:hypothetical protein
MTTTHIDDTRAADVRTAEVTPLPYRGHWRFSWGAVFAGTMVGIGTWILLHLLGMAIGLIAIDPDDAHTLRGIGMTTGIWSLIAPILAMFVGGLAAARVAGPMPPLGAVIHGAVLWSLATVASTILLVSLVSSVVGGAARLGGRAALDRDDFGVNEQLRTSGMPPQAVEQPRDAARRNQAQRGRNDAQVVTLRAAEATGKGLLGLFLAMLLGLLAALGGAILGDARERRLLARIT